MEEIVKKHLILWDEQDVKNLQQIANKIQGHEQGDRDFRI